MIVGVVKEIKNNENRVGLTPAGVDALCKFGHTVLVENNAGIVRMKRIFKLELKSYRTKRNFLMRLI